MSPAKGIRSHRPVELAPTILGAVVLVVETHIALEKKDPKKKLERRKKRKNFELFPSSAAS